MRPGFFDKYQLAVLKGKLITGAATLLFAIFFALFLTFKALFGELKNFTTLGSSSPSPFALYIFINLAFRHGRICLIAVINILMVPTAAPIINFLAGIAKNKKYVRAGTNHPDIMT